MRIQAEPLGSARLMLNGLSKASHRTRGLESAVLVVAPVSLHAHIGHGKSCSLCVGMCTQESLLGNESYCWDPGDTHIKLQMHVCRHAGTPLHGHLMKVFNLQGTRVDRAQEACGGLWVSQNPHTLSLNTHMLLAQVQTAGTAGSIICHGVGDVEP